MRLGIAEPPPDAESQREAFLNRFPQLRGRRIVLFLGRIDRKKGCDLLARAFASINPEGFELLSAGPCADPAYRAEIRANRRARPFHGNAGGRGKMGRVPMRGGIRAASHQENFGIAVAERSRAACRR